MGMPSKMSLLRGRYRTMSHDVTPCVPRYEWDVPIVRCGGSDRVEIARRIVQKVRGQHQWRICSG